jgi:hypothetical protein
MNHRCIVACLALNLSALILTSLFPIVVPAAPPQSGISTDTKYLLLDSRIVAKSQGVHLVLSKVEKDVRNPLFVEDKPWEVRIDNLYANICYDDQKLLFKCWYSPFIIDAATANTTDDQKKEMTYREALKRNKGKGREMGVCYAISKDGIVWEKPELGIVDFNGSSRNNLVMRKVMGAGVCMDPRDADPERRYKMISSKTVAFSADGIHWSEPIKCPEIAAAGDTHNNALWDAASGRYVGITRLWGDKVRIVGRTQSDDFLHWTKAEEVLRGQNPQQQVYAMPVFRYANVYLGLAMIINTQTDLVDCELAWSPDTIRWERVLPGTPLIPRGPKGSCDSGCIFAAAYPIRFKDQLLFYYGGSDGPHTNWRKGSLCLARLRTDGFAALEPSNPDQTGNLTTKPVLCAGKRLHITADAAGGSLRVFLLDADGKEIKRSKLISAYGTDATVAWEDGADLVSLVGKPVCLRFELSKAKLYAFGFEKSG